MHINPSLKRAERPIHQLDSFMTRQRRNWERSLKSEWSHAHKAIPRRLPWRLTGKYLARWSLLLRTESSNYAMSWLIPWDLCHEHLQRWWVSPQDQQGYPSKGVGEEYFSWRGDPQALLYHNWWDWSGQETEGKQQKFFSQLEGTALSHAVHEGAKYRRIDVVLNVYKEISIKDAEGGNRSSDTGIHFMNIQPGHKIQSGHKIHKIRESYSVVPETRQVSSSSW